MDRNMRSSYVNSGPRSLPHMGSNKRHNSSHNGARLSPPVQQPQHNNNHHDDIINYIYDSWNKILYVDNKWSDDADSEVTRELERGSEDAKYYQDVLPPRQLANFRPFNLEEWWARRLLQSINRKHRS